MIFSVLHEGLEFLPAYAFTNDKLQPLIGLQSILIQFAGKKVNWGMAYWFAENGYLGGKCMIRDYIETISMNHTTYHIQLAALFFQAELPDQI